MSLEPRVLKLAVCLFENVAALDFGGPVEIFGFLTESRLTKDASNLKLNPKYILDITYITPTNDPIQPTEGPLMLGSRTYDSVGPDEQFNILLVPGGYGTRPNVISQLFLAFLRRQAPGAEYVLSVCTGSWALAQAGLLGGKRATTNKASFNKVKEATKDQGITWIAKARWVVDGNYWSSSGITAGADMANAFLEYLVGEEVATKIRGVTELKVHREDEDEYAVYHGLV